jgi:hypothetical protein
LVPQVAVKPRKKKKTEAKPTVVQPKPELKTFDVVVRRTAVLEESQGVPQDFLRRTLTSYGPGTSLLPMLLGIAT